MKKFLAQFSTRFVPLYQNDDKEFFIDKLGHDKINIVSDVEDIIEDEDFCPVRLIDMTQVINAVQKKSEMGFRDEQIMELPSGKSIYLMAEYLDDEDNYYRKGIQPVELSGTVYNQRVRMIGSTYGYSPSLFKINQILGVDNGRNIIHKAQRFLNAQNNLFIEEIIDDVNSGKQISNENVQSLIYINTGLYTTDKKIINETKKEIKAYLEEDYISYLEAGSTKTRGQFLSDIASIAVEKVIEKVDALEKVHKGSELKL